MPIPQRTTTDAAVVVASRDWHPANHCSFTEQDEFSASADPALTETLKQRGIRPGDGGRWSGGDGRDARAGGAGGLTHLTAPTCR